MEIDLSKKKILFAPHEIGNQMQLLVDELRSRGYYATSATYTQEWYGYVNDIHLNLSEQSKAKKHLNALLFTLWAAQNFDIFHFFWGESLYGIGNFMHLDLPMLKQKGKKIFVHFRGSDLVDKNYHNYLFEKEKDSNTALPPMSNCSQIKSLEIWRKYADALFVSTPDLLSIVPEAILVQQAIRLEEWIPSNSLTHDKLIRIAHAPTLRRKKGTEFVVDAVQSLRDEGYPVELVLIENIPANQVKPLYETCDIVVDQVLYGWYGKVSIEAMALGKPAVCYIDPEWLSHRPDCPIVNASPSNLKEEIKNLMRDGELRSQLGVKGQTYVRKYHDIKSITDQCLSYYIDAYAK
jgi:glycosyltransferase involved in cell wall biosynthesis